MPSARKNIMLGTAGHVDHGKTALVKLLTGCNTDTLAEERARGLTIDLGFAPCRMADRRVVGVVDVPGHADFIRHMVAGAQGVDVVVMVVAADDGVMPQTREHLHILSLMGLRHGLVALTKIDLVEPARRECVVHEARRLLAGTFLESAAICPMSSLTGEGYDTFFDALNDVVDACEDRPCAGLFRAWVADVLTIRGFGTVVTAIPSSGRVRVGDRLRLLPSGALGRVRRLEVYGEDAAEGRAGECVAINLPELERDSVRRGMVLCESAALAPVRMVEAELHLLDSVQGQLPDYAEVHLHVGTASGLTRVAMLDAAEMGPGQSELVQLRLTEPLGLVPGDRFVIRADLPGSGQAGLTTIGGGRILGTSNLRLRRRKPWTLAALGARRLALDDPVAWGALMLREAGRPLRLTELATLGQWREDEATRVVEVLRDRGTVRETSGHGWVHQNVVAQMAEKVLAALQQFHEANPDRLGLGLEALTDALKVEPPVLDMAVESLLQVGRVERGGALFALAGRTVRLPSEDERMANQMAAQFQQAAWTAPALEDLAAALHQPVAHVARLAELLAERGTLVKLADRMFLHRDAVEKARQVALRLFARAPSFSTMEFRDALAVSRKYAVPLLDHLDAIRFTVRTGHTRTPGAEAKRLGAR